MEAFDSNEHARYLAVKKYIDDRSLNPRVWQAFAEAVSSTERGRPLRIIEMGAGIGTMLARVVERRLARHMNYTAVEKHPDFPSAFRAYLEQWGADRGADLSWQRPDEATLLTDYSRCRIKMVHGDLYDIIRDPGQRGKWDGIIAHAVMDLVHIEETLDGFRQLVHPGGCLYLSLNYDGHSGFHPPVDPIFEKRMINLYHASMDHRVVNGRTSGSSRAGRDILRQLEKMMLPVTAAGRSDWTVGPCCGSYPADHAFFLEFIIRTIHQELDHHPDLDPQRLVQWTETRRAQIRFGKLSFVARNMDFLARVPEKG